MTDRYFVEPPIQGDRASLTGPEAHHAIHVMRAKPGATVVLFDGSGAEFPARVERVARDHVDLAVLERLDIDREAPVRIILGTALPKGERQRWLVEKAVELGVARLVPLVTARSVARPTPPALARLRRTVIEASKQCGRNRLAAIGEPTPWADFVSEAGSEIEAAPCRLLAHPEIRSRVAGLSATAEVPARDSAVLAVGPEGGFTDDEAALAFAAGWRAIDLGPRTLRIETAAVLLTAIVLGRTE
jgi:16S rRNA (uracil1498-N3)-methyltransferase